jgi:predicted methyltransferase
LTRRALTQLAHERVTAHLRLGDSAIDATVGNGHDTCFLADAVGPGGAVAGFDVQARALSNTAARLRELSLERRVRLVQAGHERLRELLPPDWRGAVGAAMFNLGYLPGGDKQVVTRAETTLPALSQALAMLRPGGLLTVLVYRGHAGGADELDAIEHWLDGIGDAYDVQRHDSPGPVLFAIAHRCGDRATR